MKIANEIVMKRRSEGDDEGAAARHINGKISALYARIENVSVATIEVTWHRVCLLKYTVSLLGGIGGGAEEGICRRVVTLGATTADIA